MTIQKLIEVYQFGTESFLNADREKKVPILAFLEVSEHFNVIEKTMDLKALIEEYLDELFAVLFEQRFLEHRLVHVQFVAALALENLA